MLPPRLKQIKDRLDSKAYSDRNRAEDELLIELNALDKSPELRDFLINEGKVMKMTSGPTGVCACCGR